MSNLIINKKSPIIQNTYQANGKSKFHSTDDEISFNRNKLLKGEEWRYRDMDIDYEFNDWGYRTKNIEDLDREYLLTFGCSLTEGVGLHQDEMWATKLSNELKLDLFNLGMQSTGIDFQFYNTILFNSFSVENKWLPKMVVYQWPSNYRTTTFLKSDDNHNELDLHLIFPHELKNKKVDLYVDWYMKSFIDNGGEMVKQYYFYPLICNLLWKMCNVPVYNITYEDNSEINCDSIFNYNIEVERIFDDTKITARDCSHNGYLTQDIIVNTILNKMK